MGRKILLNGKITGKPLKLPVTSPALNHGKGVFETMLYEKRKLYFYEAHLKRMADSCNALNPDFDFRDLSPEGIIKLIKRNGDTEKCLRVKILYLPLGTKWSCVVYTRAYRRLTDSLTVCNHFELRQRLFTRYKTCSYYENLYWKDFYARRYRADEVLFRNLHGHYLEGSYTNLFCVKDDVLYYPHPGNDFLQGIMHSKIIKNYRAIGFENIVCKRTGLRDSLLKSSDEVVLSNSLFIARNVGIFHDTLHNKTCQFMQQRWARKIRDYFLG